MAKQMLEIGCKMKTVDNGLGNYNDRVYRDEHGKLSFWNEQKYAHYNEQPHKNGVHDHSRSHLNFEVNLDTGKAQPMVIKKKGLRQRVNDVIKKYCKAKQTYVNPKTGEVFEKDRPIRKSDIKCFEVLFGGDRKRMHTLAFIGDVVVGKEGLGKNGHVKRSRAIELWAEDCYKWACKHFGKENIVTFVVHLDETNPHIHCDIVPLLDGKLSYTHMMHGERVEGETKTNSKQRASEYYKKLHDDFALNVGLDWGFSRGEDTKVTGAKHKSMKEYQEDVRKYEQAIRALETKKANLEKKHDEMKISEEEYQQKLEYYNGKLAEVRGRIAEELNAQVEATVAKRLNGKVYVQGEINGKRTGGFELKPEEIEHYKSLMKEEKVLQAEILLWEKAGQSYRDRGYKFGR